MFPFNSSKIVNPYIVTNVVSIFNKAVSNFIKVELVKVINTPPLESFQSYVDLLEYLTEIYSEIFSYVINVTGLIGDFTRTTPFSKQMKLLDTICDLHRTVNDVKLKYGINLNNGKYLKIEETDRFVLYQVLPISPDIKTQIKSKPILIIPSYILGPNILAFLPEEGKSLVHAFANQGIPTYIRILKDIEVIDAVQVMTLEDDICDTRFFCEIIKARHKKDITLSGYSQGGFIALLNILSQKLTGFVDGLITLAAPMDGTRDMWFYKRHRKLSARFLDINYLVKTMPNGNKVVDCSLLILLHALNSFRDYILSEEISEENTLPLLLYRLFYDQSDLPLEIVQKTLFDSYLHPVTTDGTLPIKVYNRNLNFKNIEGISWLICYAIDDITVGKENALAPLDYVNAEVAAFPKGHSAIARIWSLTTSECSLFSKFGNNCRGPLRYHMDLDSEIDKNYFKAKNLRTI